MTAAGRAAVVGVVADSALGFPVAGATVYFTDSRDPDDAVPRPRNDLPSDTTTRNGGFALANVAPGTYQLVVRDLSFFPARRFVVLHADRVDTVVIRLRRVRDVGPRHDTDAGR